MPTKIEWTDETWNPVTGCTPVSEGCALRLWRKHVVARDVDARSPTAIKASERLTTPTRTSDDGVGFTWLSPPALLLSMFKQVVQARWHYFEVFRPIVGSVTISMVDKFLALQGSPQYLPRNKPMLVDIAANVSARMVGASNENVSLGSDRSSTSPIMNNFPNSPLIPTGTTGLRRFLLGLATIWAGFLFHTFSITQGLPERKGVMPHA